MMVLHQVALYQFSIGTIFISAFATLSLCIGVFSPAWIVVHRKGVRISEGPWYTRACPDEERDCILSTRETIYGIHSDGRGDSPLADDHWLAVQILSTAAVILSFLSLTVVVYAFIKRSSTSIHWVQIVGGVLLLITCIVSLVSVLKVMWATKDINTSAPWSRDITFAGSVAAFAASVLYVFAIGQSCGRNLKLKKIKRRTHLSRGNTGILGCECSNSLQSENIQYITLDSIPDAASLSRSLRQIPSTVENSGTLPSTYSIAPPAYSEIYR